MAVMSTGGRGRRCRRGGGRGEKGEAGPAGCNTGVLALGRRDPSLIILSFSTRWIAAREHCFRLDPGRRMSHVTKSGMLVLHQRDNLWFRALGRPQLFY